MNTVNVFIVNLLKSFEISNLFIIENNWAGQIDQIDWCRIMKKVDEVVNHMLYY